MMVVVVVVVVICVSHLCVCIYVCVYDLSKDVLQCLMRNQFENLGEATVTTKFVFCVSSICETQILKSVPVAVLGF